MRTKVERQEAFMKDFQALLNKHGAELDVGDSGESYGMHTGTASITLFGEWSEDNECTAEYVDFELPTWMKSE